MYQHTPTHIQMYPNFIQPSERYPNAPKHRKHTQAHQHKPKHKEISPGTEIIPYTGTYTQIHQHMSGQKYAPKHPNPIFQHTPRPDKSIRGHRNMNKP